MGYAAQESGEGAPRTTGANKGAGEEQAVCSKSDGPMRHCTTMRPLRRTTRNVSVRALKSILSSLRPKADPADDVEKYFLRAMTNLDAVSMPLRHPTRACAATDARK